MHTPTRPDTRRGRHIRPRPGIRRILISSLLGLGLAIGIGAAVILEKPAHQSHSAAEKLTSSAAHPVNKNTAKSTQAPISESSGQSGTREGAPAPSPSPQSSPTPTPSPTATKPKPAPSAPQGTIDEVLTLVNNARAEAGCGTVRIAPQLVNAATDHSADMASNNYFSHTSLDGRSPWDRAKAAGYQFASAENIAKGQSDAAAVMQAWMDSPGHRKNILNCASNTIGLGVVKSGDGIPYWTQMFGAE